MTYKSHDVLVEQQTVDLGPFATFREPGQGGDFPKSAVRALQTLEYFSLAGKPLRAIEIAGALGLSPSSTNELLKSLTDWGYLIFDPVSKLYHCSPRVTRLAQAANREYGGPDALDRLLRAVLVEFGLPVSISASQGSFMQVIDFLWPEDRDPSTLPYKAEQSARSPFPLNIGLHSPMFGSCPGAAWLSTQSEQRVRETIRLCRRDLGHFADDEATILHRLADISEQGYAFGGISTDESYRGLSVPLPATPHGIVLILSMVGPRAEMEVRREEIAGRLPQFIAQY